MKMCETTNEIKVMVVQYFHFILCFTYFRTVFKDIINFIISFFYIANKYALIASDATNN